MHYFNKSLEKGKLGEAMLMELWPDLEQLKGRKSDFKVKSTGKLVELKSDQYDMAKTDNFFIELWSDSAKLKPGGPLQAMMHASDYWVYLFVQNKTMFVFNTNELVDWVMRNSNKYERISIVNQGWVTTGIKVPRLSLASLYTRQDCDE